ncbi:MAG TPA: FeoA family protein [Terracidiphilus sp.]|jgi:Fe2+ transport system protein FeoA
MKSIFTCDLNHFLPKSLLLQTNHRSDELDQRVHQGAREEAGVAHQAPNPRGQIMGMLKSGIPQMHDCSRSQFGRILNYDHSGRIFLLSHRFGRHSGVRQVSVLSDLTVGERGILVALDLPENVQNHLMHMGFVPDAEVTALRRAPAGDPTVYGVDGLEIALRHETASAIQVRPAVAQAADSGSDINSTDETPRLAEAAR